MNLYYIIVIVIRQYVLKLKMYLPFDLIVLLLRIYAVETYPH